MSQPATPQKTKLNNADMQKLFGVSYMSILHWRKGTPRKTPLPHTVDKKGSPAYAPKAVASWAKKNGVEMTCEPEKLLTDKPAKARAAKAGAKKPLRAIH